MAKRHITVVGLGPGNIDQLSLAAWQALKQASRLVLRTANHPTATQLAQHNIDFHTFDDIYETKQTFTEVYKEIVRSLLIMANDEPLTYATPGHPLVGEATVQLLLEQERQHNVELSIVPSMSALDAIFLAAKLDPIHGLQIMDATHFQLSHYNPQQPALFMQVYNQLSASHLKLELLNVLDAQTPVVMVQAAGLPNQERVVSMPLYKIDRVQWIDHLTSLYVPQSETSIKPTVHSLDPLANVMQRLLDDDGCPWDRQQTHLSLTRYLIEETCEVIDAIENGDMAGLQEELGDVLLQIVFHAELARRENAFNIDNVVSIITEKMIRRHPHVFSDTIATDATTVLRNWEQIKQTEKGHATTESGKMAALPRLLPALMQATTVQKRAAEVGFEWADITGAINKVHEEIAELEAAYASKDSEAMRMELGDVLFALVNVSRYLHVDAEEALRATNRKFIQRFRHIEEAAIANGRKLTEMSLEEMDHWWNEAKLKEQHNTTLANQGE